MPETPIDIQPPEGMPPELWQEAFQGMWARVQSLETRNDALVRMAQANTATIHELATHNQALTNALHEAERRAREAEATRKALLEVSEGYLLEIRDYQRQVRDTQTEVDRLTAQLKVKEQASA